MGQEIDIFCKFMSVHKLLASGIIKLTLILWGDNPPVKFQKPLYIFCRKFRLGFFVVEAIL